MGAFKSKSSKMKFLITLCCIVASFCYITDAQSMASMSCKDETTGIHYNDGDKWTQGTCMDCSCSQTKRLLKICHTMFLGYFTPDQELILENTILPCKVIDEEKAATLPTRRVVRIYTKDEFASCCSRLFTPVGVHEDCVANLVEGECRYEVVNKETGADCEHPYGMVGKK